MYSKTTIFTQTFELITAFKITKTLLQNIIVHLINNETVYGTGT